MNRMDVAMLILRLCFGLSMAWHGLNKVRGPRGISGTAGWFESIGMRSPMLNARLAAATEIAAGIALAIGFATPVASSAFVGLMVVAIVTVHWKVGFFVFLPHQGWEYCASIAVTAVAIALLGPGSISLDNAFGIAMFDSGPAAWLAAPIGIVAALCQLSLYWRPGRIREAS